MSIRRVLCSHHGFLFFVMTVVLTGCGWSGDRANELYWQETYEDIPADHQKTPKSDEVKTKKNQLKSMKTESPDRDETLTLHECFGRALRFSHQLRMQSERIFQEERREREIISTILPSARVIGSFTRDSAQIPFGSTPQDRFEYYYEVEQTIFSGEYLPEKRRNQMTQNIEQLRLKEQRNQLLFQVASEFFTVLQYESDIQALEAALTSVQEFVNVVEARREAGVASRDELLLARARLEDVRSTLTSRRYDRRQARARLAELISVNRLTAELEDQYQVRWQNPDVPVLVRRSKKQSPEARIARNQIKQARASKDRVRSEYLPNIDATFTYHANRKDAFNRFIDWTLGIVGTWTLYDGGGREARMAKSYSNIREAKLQQKQLNDRLRREILEATYAFQSLDKTTGNLKNRKESAQEAVEVVESRYRAGEATNLDVLRAQETAEDATRNYERARLARKLAALRIHFATGQMQKSGPVTRIFDETNQ